MNEQKTEAIVNADAYTNNAGLPTYSDLLSLASRLAYPSGGELLTLEDYRNISRNIVQPDGVRII